jgi:hypothetical protein
MVRARRGTFSFSQGLTGLRMDQVQQVADPLIVVDRGPLLGRQRPGPGFLGEDVHSLAVARLEVDLENGTGRGRGKAMALRADEPGENRQVTIGISRHRGHGCNTRRELRVRGLDLITRAVPS